MKGYTQYLKKEYKELIVIFLLPIVILVLHSVLSFNDVYNTIPWIDIPMHFFGGVSIGVSYTLLLKNLHNYGFIDRMNVFIFFIFVVSLVSLTIVIWEFSEFVLDSVDHKMRQTSLDDTMLDLFLGLVGGTIGYYIISLKFRKGVRS